MEKRAAEIRAGATALGIELGSTRIKATLIGEDCTPIATGSHEWENHLEDGVWTYALEEVWHGVQAAYKALTQAVQCTYGETLATVGAIGISAMMHGYLVFDEAGEQLVPFRTWRNTMTEEAASQLTEEFSFNIPQRWSIAHLYQAMINGEAHLPKVAFMTTLAGYVHWQLTGEKVLGIGEASGMFPIDSNAKNYHAGMLGRFDALAEKKGFPKKIEDVLPCVLDAGEAAGTLSPQGARRIDPTGTLQAGIPLCPPEGDAGTGMVATNSVAVRTGNISAGTSVFAMLVLEKALSKVYPEIDMVTTPDGRPVAMVHCNNCTSDLNAWVKLFGEVLHTFGADVQGDALFGKLYETAMHADADAGGMISYNYYSGEPITQLDEGRPLLVRLPDSAMRLDNFMRNLLYASMSTLKIGMDILTENEQVQITQLTGHGGLFRTKGVGQSLMATVLGVPVTVMESAGEGGPWGMALLAMYMRRGTKGETLDEFLKGRVFAKTKCESIAPRREEQAGYAAYLKRYTEGLAIEKAAVEHLR